MGIMGHSANESDDDAEESDVYADESDNDTNESYNDPPNSIAMVEPNIQDASHQAEPTDEIVD